MKSNKYSILDNEGGGDCFFAVLRDGLKTQKIDVSVKTIREKLANEVDDEVFNNYKEFFSIYYGGLKKSQEKIKEFKRKHLLLKKMIGGTSDGNDKIKLLNEAKGNFSNLSSALDESKEFEDLTQEMEFMKDVNSIEDLKNVIKKVAGNYWADSWAVTTLERLYNVKFIILSKKHFDDGESENVLQCGEADKKLQEKQIFEPDFYIITDYILGIHYKLITYDKNSNKGAFKFKELPYKIKELVLEKCLEKCAGPFALIPDFKEFANCNNIKINPKIDEKYESLVDKPKSNLYDKSIIIQIYNKSKHDKVGEGSGESITPELKTSKNVLELNNKKKYPEWRKKLDNDFLVANLVIEGNEWSSIKHYILGSRFSNLPDIYNKFMKNGEFGVNIENANKLYNSIKNKKEFKEKIISDEEFDKNLSGLLEKALYSKFTQNEELKNILLLTQDALINVYKPGKGASEANELMKVRQLLGK